MIEKAELCRGHKLIDYNRHSFLTNKLGRVYYPIQQWVIPVQGCGPLAVFETYPDALKFSKEMEVYSFMKLTSQTSKIVVCHFKPSSELFLHVGELGEDNLRVRRIDKCPSGTALAEAVFCLE